MLNDRSVLIQDKEQRIYIRNVDDPSKDLILHDKLLIGSLLFVNKYLYVLEREGELVQFYEFQRTGLGDCIQQVSSFAGLANFSRHCNIPRLSA